MRRKIHLIIITAFLISSCFFPVFGQENQTESDLQKKIQEYEAKLSELRQQKGTLYSQIQYMETQIYLTGLKIQETENKIEKTGQEIDTLSTKIEGLDESLNYLLKTLIKRVIDGYKKRTISYLSVFFDSKNASEFLNEYKYLRTAQDNNQKLIVRVQSTKNNFEEQKKLREEKKKELDALSITLANQKIDLNNQKAGKQKLLVDTQNNEAIYQRLLAQAQAEYAAIQGIVSGGGSETKTRDVSRGETIAYVIQGASCNSSGGHLHFIVQENNSVSDPFNYLKSTDYRNCSGSYCDSNDGDSFNPSGGWDWPLSSRIELEQGYGSTWAVRNTWVGQIYSFHNGIDINGSSNEVKAVADGALYKGTYSVGCPLLYVKLVHKDSNLVTYYLHVYSN